MIIMSAAHREDVVAPDARRGSIGDELNRDEADAKAASRHGGSCSRAEAEARAYLDSRRFDEFLGFLMSHLVVAQPDDPLAYLHGLLDRCVLFRAGLVEPPLLFAPRHIESIYKSLDPGGLGYISLNQYAVGMKTLGIDCFNANPMACQCDPDSVDKETFEQEAKCCLTKMLKEMIVKPRVCAEGRD